MASSQHSVPDDVLVRAIVAHRKVNPAAYQGVGLTVIEETAMAAALTQVKARIEVELELRKAAYERIRNLEEQLEATQNALNGCETTLRSIAEWVEENFREGDKGYQLAIIARAASSPASEPKP